MGYINDILVFTHQTWWLLFQNTDIWDLLVGLAANTWI
jgi:hypothetical protein